jgi:hypothetical protein
MFNFDINPLRKSIAELSGQVRELRQTIERKRREREDIATAPPSFEDVYDVFVGWMDRTRDDYLKRLRFTWGSAFASVEALQNPEQVTRRMTLAGKTKHVGGLGGDLGSDVDGILCCFFGDQVREALKKAMLSDAWPAGGLPIKQRAAKLKELDAELERLTRKHDELTAAANNAGIRIDPLTPAEARMMKAAPNAAAPQLEPGPIDARL